MCTKIVDVVETERCVVCGANLNGIGIELAAGPFTAGGTYVCARKPMCLFTAYAG